VLEDDLRFNAEFGCDLVHAWVCHKFSCLGPGPRAGSGVMGGRNSFRAAH
jgi:hypothetical protein